MKHVFVVLCALFLAGCGLQDKASVVLRGPQGQTVHVSAEIADTPEERSRGLMFRHALAPDEGMIFVFEQPAPLAFWMKNTLIPLDIVFFDQQGRYLSSDTMVPCEADPCPTYGSKGDAAYVLEMATGFLQREAIGSGWTLDMNALPASLVPWN